MRDRVRCNTGIDLTVAQFLQFDGVPGARHTVPARLHCGLQHAHPGAHHAFAQAPGDNPGDVWWLRWDASTRTAIELTYCLAKDPNWPPDADEDDDRLCGLPQAHPGDHEWQLERPSLDCTPGAHPVTEQGKDTLRRVPTPAGPLIRVHRYEYILAIKWPEFDRWLMIWPDEYARADPANPHAPDERPAATTGWRPVMFGNADFEDLNEWIDPAADRHRDLTKWTTTIRESLARSTRSVDSVLQQIEAHPYNR